MKNNYKKTIALLSGLLLTSSCSLIGIQSEEGPKYKVLVQEDAFEIRQYEPYIIAKTTVLGNMDDSSGDAFRILAGYIFGKNKGDKKIAMTSPVEIETASTKIAMTSPVEMSQSGDTFTMAFSMPSKYKLEDLPEPLDNRISFEKVEAKLVAVHRFSWFSSQARKDHKAQELREWLKSKNDYEAASGYSYAGYNPPWTIPFLRRNEVLIKLQPITKK